MCFRFLHFKILLTALFLLITGPLSSQADTVLLKNGMRFTSDRVWEENGEIKCFLNGLVVGFPKEGVARIDKAPPESLEMSAPAAEDSLKYDLDAVKKQLEQKKTALDLEYQALMQGAERLEPEKNHRITGIEADQLNERILRHNRKVKEFEHKKKAFDIEVQAYQKQVENESLMQLTDLNKFSEKIKTRLKQPIDDFIADWGYPDQIINMPDGSRHYFFSITITPELIRQIIFDVNQSGKIVTFQTKNQENSHGVEK